MRGLMMDYPLAIGAILRHAARWHGDARIVSRTVEGKIHRYTYRDAAARCAQLANALRALGVAKGDRVGTLAWNTYRHFELYYAISGSGAITHTINPRLHPEQIAYIINHAHDRYVFVDSTFVPLLESIAIQLDGVRGFVILTGEDSMPPTTLRGAIAYETLLARESRDFAWPVFDEHTASSLCYTSGTTGNPKGVLYSHRSTVLHAFSGCMAEMWRRAKSPHSLMPIVPMFHVNAWGFPYCAPMMGADLVLPGAAHDAASLYDLLAAENVTLAGAVPLIWLRLLDYLEETGKNLPALSAIRVGGSAAPASLIEAYEARGIEVVHGWGMTETSPVCTTGSLKFRHRAGPERLQYARKAGRAIFGAELKVVDETGRELPDDGRSQGELCVRGPWVASAYYEDSAASASAFTGDGWFRTGDIATLDSDGYLTIADRRKDLIKSGGEWISSIDLENAAIGHPEIEEAAAIAVPHPEYGERPLLVVVRRPGSALEPVGVLAYLEGKVAKWWLPDAVVFVDEMPHAATGKISKKTLRERFASQTRSGSIR